MAVACGRDRDDQFDGLAFTPVDAVGVGKAGQSGVADLTDDTFNPMGDRKGLAELRI